MDIENFIDYNIANIYVGNLDWPGNNVCIWNIKQMTVNHPEAILWTGWTVEMVSQRH
jgi:hypothetical protein